MTDLAARGEIAQRVRAGRPLEHIPVVDFHTHLGASSDYYYVPRSDAGAVVRCMDRYGIDHIVTFAITVTSDPGPGNRLQYAASESFPSRISALTMLHAGFPQDWIALLEEGVGRGCRGIKLISQYQGVAEQNIDWSPAFEFARDRNWVVLHHSWGSPERLQTWAERFPELVFIVGHATTGYRDVVRRCENVYQCTCAAFVASAFASVDQMVQAMPAEKILYGSDALDLDFGTGIGPIAYAELPEATKARLLGGNAVDVFSRLGWDIKLGQ